MEFPPVSTEEWEAAVRVDLKGRDPASLGKILYVEEDAPSLGEQPWPARCWEIWAEASDPARIQRALDRGAEHVLTSTDDAEVLSDELTITEQLARLAEPPTKGAGHCWIIPVGPLYFEEIAKFRAMRRLRPAAKLIARTSKWHATAYDPHVNLLRATTEAMAAILGGCDALIVGLFTEARGESDDFAERLALNTQLLLRDESYFGQVTDPAAGSWYIEALTASMLDGTYSDRRATAFVGVNRYPNPQETPPKCITPGRAMSVLEECRRRAAKRPPTARLVLGKDAKMSHARAAFSRDFFVAGGFTIVDSGEANLTILCDADANYPATREFPILAAGLDFDRNSDHAAVICDLQNRLGL